MRRVWVALATAQHQAGLVSEAQLADLQAHAGKIDIERALEIEKEIESKKTQEDIVEATKYISKKYL